MNTYQKVKRTASKRSCALSFYINSLLIQDLHKLFAGDGLFLIQELCKLVELRAVLLQNPHRLRVLLLHKVNHLSVDLCLRFGRCTLSEASPPRYWLVTVSSATISKLSLMP